MSFSSSSEKKSTPEILYLLPDNGQACAFEPGPLVGFDTKMLADIIGILLPVFANSPHGH